ncbi:hypothetical protein GF354_01970 [Candidatus Peregrinibacteria bacterium]|nr:hypothetical protein [Candidatus Peregrinibacteria bacterium]
MPKRNNKIYCIQHTDEEMISADGLHALTKITKKGENLTFHPSSGIPIKVFYCKKCGYIENYAAKISPDIWNKDSE